MTNKMASILKFKDKSYNFLTNPKTIKFSLYLSFLTFIPILIIGILIAQLDPDGYNFVDNYISDLGSFNHTPAPYIWDFGQMITSILLVPFALYMEKQIAPFPEKAEDLKNCSRMRFRLSSAGLTWMLVGLIGLFGVGLFSEDRSDMLASIGLRNLHELFSLVVFLGIGIAAVFYGLGIVFYDTIVPKSLGIFMVFFPFSLAVIYFSTIIILLEWILLLSLFIWILPSALIFIKHANKELKLKQ